MHALDLASENQWLRVLQSNRTLVSMTILNFYNDKRGSTSLNDDCAKRFLKRAWSREQSLWSDHLLPGTQHCGWTTYWIWRKQRYYFISLTKGTYHWSREHGIHLAQPIISFFVCLPKGTYHRSREHGIHLVRQLHFLLLITAQANPISHATDPGNMTCYCR